MSAINIISERILSYYGEEVFDMPRKKRHEICTQAFKFYMSEQKDQIT